MDKPIVIGKVEVDTQEIKVYEGHEYVGSTQTIKTRGEVCSKCGIAADILYRQSIFHADFHGEGPYREEFNAECEKCKEW